MDRSKIVALIEKCGPDLISHATAGAVNSDSDSATFCHNCCTTLKKKKCPTLSIANGMKLDVIPEELLQPTDLEQQLFARMLVFTKIVQLPCQKIAPQNRMKGLTGKMINVPLEQSDISNSIKTLPRCIDDAAVVPLQLKKKKEIKSAYAEAFIRPKICIKAVQKLKELKNPHYTNVEIDENFMAKGKEKRSQTDKNETTESDIENDEEKSDSELANIEMLNSVKKYQADREENTCLIREDLEAIVVENQTEKTIHKKNS